MTQRVHMKIIELFIVSNLLRRSTSLILRMSKAQEDIIYKTYSWKRVKARKEEAARREGRTSA